MSVQDTSVTALLASVRAGKAGSLEALFAAVYQELHGLARQVRIGKHNHTVNTTALVHEAYLKLAGHGNWESRLHFMRTAAKAMRQILIGQARKKVAQKRGGDALNITFEDELHGAPVNAEQLLSLDEALNALQKIDPRMAQVVECRYFAGMSLDETAAALDISARTVKRDWRTARAFLADAMRKA